MSITYGEWVDPEHAEKVVAALSSVRSYAEDTLNSLDTSGLDLAVEDDIKWFTVLNLDGSVYQRGGPSLSVRLFSAKLSTAVHIDFMPGDSEERVRSLLLEEVGSLRNRMAVSWETSLMVSTYTGSGRPERRG